MIYVFNDYELDTVRYELRHSNTPVPIEPKVFDLLIYLIEHQSQVVTKEDLYTHLWPDQFVSESALTYCISSARKAVGDTGRNQQSIKTVHQRGYTFIAPVHSKQGSLGDTSDESGASADTPVPEPTVSSPAPAASPEPLTAERRQLTVMWCSMAIASESALQLDPEEQHEMLLQAHPLLDEVIHRFEGYVAQRAGHGLFVYFGYPQARENDAHPTGPGGRDLRSCKRFHRCTSKHQGQTRD